MAEIRTVIVDDEPLARRGLRQLLAAHPDVAIVGECRDGREALRAIEVLAPDLVLLDVQMPDLDGFAVLRICGAERMPPVVFVTAYDAFAVQAFEACALDYLVKPVGEARFQATMARVRERMRVADAMAMAERLSALLAADAARRRGAPGAVPRFRGTGSGRLRVDTAGGALLLDPGEVDWIEAQDYYAAIHAGTMRYLLRATLTALERRLDPAKFFRVHRGAIVRLDAVREVRSGAGGAVVAVLADGTCVPVSRRRRARLDALLRSESAGG